MNLTAAEIRSGLPGDADAIRGLEGLSPSSARLIDHDLQREDRCVLVAVTDIEATRPAGGNADIEAARPPGGNADIEAARAADDAVGSDASGDEVVGVAAALVQVGEAQVLDLVVRPALRGQGLGGALLDRLIAEVESRDASAVSLEVSVDNLAAQALYRRRGFVVEGRRPDYYGPGQDALIMWRRPDGAPNQADTREED